MAKKDSLVRLAILLLAVGSARVDGQVIETPVPENLALAAARVPGRFPVVSYAF